MMEIEIKARIESIAEIEDRIIQKGGEFRKEVTEEDLYFNHPSRSFKDTDEALRLRRVEGKIFLTYKGPKVDRLTKTREEFNVEVDDWEASLNIIQRLGFTEVLTIIKRRRYLKLQDYEIMLDRLEGLGTFIEVEKVGEQYDPEELFRVLKSLGVEGSITRSYLEMALEKLGNP